MKDKVIIDKSFKSWTRRELQLYLGLQRKKDFQPLENWLEMEKNIDLSAKDDAFLTALRDDAEEVIDLWNETELRENFILELTKRVNFRNKSLAISNFAERYFSEKIVKDNILAKLHGYVDWMVASGIGYPEKPFFFIHEYKPSEGQTNDGKGQLLAAMYTLQHLNNQKPQPTLFGIPKHFYKNIPIYGAYVIGRYWYFAALEGDNYNFSEGFISTKKSDLISIFKILKAQKQIIHNIIPVEQI